MQYPSFINKGSTIVIVAMSSGVGNRITDFEKCCKFIDACQEFPKNRTKLCDWCDYQEYCESEGKIDWMILS